MAELEKQQEQQEVPQTAAAKQQPASLQENLDILTKYGGFDLLEGTI